MAKVRIDVRFEGALLLWVDAYAKERGTSRTAVLEAAARELRDQVEAGSSARRRPGWEAVREAQRSVGSVREVARGAYWEMMRARQERLNRGGR
jgi:hypothetical protein